MICSKCGTEIADGMRFCTMCGTPVSAPATGDIDTTVMVNQSDGSSAQPQMSQPQMTQPQMVQPQMGQGTYNQYNGQPQMAQPQMGQGMYNQYNGQPQMGQGMYNQYNTQPQMGQGMYNQYNGQPQMAPKPPKPLKKSLSPKAKKVIIIGGVVVALLAVFFLVVWPIIKRSKLEGEYICKDSYSNYQIIFDDGTYVTFDEDGYGTEAGTYVIKDDKVTMTSLSGEETSAKFDADENILKMEGYLYNYKYKSKDPKKTIGINLTENYVDDLEDRIEEIVPDVIDLTDDDYVYDWYYIYGDDLAEGDEFERELGDALNYDDDKTLQFLLENDFISIDIYIDGGDIDVDVYAWY